MFGEAHRLPLLDSLRLDLALLVCFTHRRVIDACKGDGGLHTTGKLD
jgi:hypothetical protein